MRNYVQPILFIILYCGFLVYPSHSETLMGVVKDTRTGTGIGGITVKVLYTAFQTTTNPDGSYEIDGIPEGVYSLLYGGQHYSTKILPSVSLRPYIVGDANGDSQVSVSDVIYLINYLFKGGSAPIPIQAGDCNCDTQVSVSDVIYLINYLFKGGPPPNC